ncbi:SH3 domain-containing protein (plasmid) [Burkholderia ambifaria]
MTNKHSPHHPPKQAAHAAKPAESAVVSAQPVYTPLAWSYPFSPAGKEDVGDPMTYMKALASAEDGFYPLGASGIWHGGIHFDQKTGAALKQGDGVRAIAKGEVVAYRLDSKYPELAYQDKRYALYSTGFVLIRHTLQLPPEPKKPEPAPAPSKAPTDAAAPSGASAPAGASVASATPTGASSKAPAPASPPPDETLTFFSLYMHTLDWASYKEALDHAKSDPKAPQLRPMLYWEADRYYRVGDKDKQEVPKPKPIDHDVLGDLINADFDMSKLSPEQRAADEAPPEPVQGTRVRVAPNGKILGLLPKGTELTVDESDNGGTPGWAKIGKIKSGKPVGAVVGQPPSEHLPWGYVYVKELQPVSQSGPVDTVVVLKKPHAVEAGEVIAYLGQYQRYREAKPTPPQPNRPLLHLEVFAGPDLPKFIDKSRARAGTLHDKTFLEILAGAQLVTDISRPDYLLEKAGLKLAPVSDPKSRWVKVQPKVVTMPAPQPAVPATPKGKQKPSAKKPDPIETATGDPFWVDSSLVNQTTKGPVQGWKEFPLKVSRASGPGTDFRNVFRVVDLDKLGTGNFAREEKDANGKTKRWWNVKVGTKDGATRQGWVREEDHPQARLCGPWDWPGFERVDNSSIKPVEMFKRYLFVAELAMGDDQQAFKPSADQLATSDLIQKLEKAIDSNHDGKVTAEELAASQQTPWLAEAISHMIVKSESEWGGNMGKWEEILPHMKLVPWKWQNEMERIKKLQWWEQIKGVQGFPQDAMPWHFHPIGIIGNFKVGSGTALDELIRKIGDIIASGEGSYDAYNTGTKDVPGGQPGHAYIHGGPAGLVTKKTINEILATEPLSGTDPNRMFATGKYQTTFPTLRAGVARLSLSGSEIYDAEMQERMFRDFLFDKAGGGKLSAFVKHGKGTIDDGVFGASQEWASIAVPNGYPTNKVKKHPDGTKERVLSDGTLTYFQNEGAANKANMTSTKRLREILEEIQGSR